MHQPRSISPSVVAGASPGRISGDPAPHATQPFYAELEDLDALVRPNEEEPETEQQQPRGGRPEPSQHLAIRAQDAGAEVVAEVETYREKNAAGPPAQETQKDADDHRHGALHGIQM
ncbi:MAG: hypothetical protein AAFY88_07355, partial [Acidobacteriota bacterium]